MTLVAVGAFGFACVGRYGSRQVGTTDWRVTGGDPGNSRYSPLAQINRTNVGTLRVAWIYQTGDGPADGRSEIQATPVVVDGVLYTTTPALAVVALRADSGTRRSHHRDAADLSNARLRERQRRVLEHAFEFGQHRVLARRDQRGELVQALEEHPALGGGQPHARHLEEDRLEQGQRGVALAAPLRRLSEVLEGHQHE